MAAASENQILKFALRLKYGWWLQPMAMKDNRDNDTSVQSKVERDKTVATKEGSPERTSGW